MFLYSRPKTAGLLVALPYLLLRAGVRTMISEARQVREEILPAIRYIATGDHERPVTAAVADRSRAAGRKVVRTTYDQVVVRVIALLLLVALPAILVFAIVQEAYENGTFRDFVRAVKGLLVTIATAREPRF
jgi:hypothetical protein